MSLSLDVVVLLYLVASVCFIQALKGLSHQAFNAHALAFGLVRIGPVVVLGDVNADPNLGHFSSLPGGGGHRLEAVAENA